ncbi:MAG: glycosyl hydrolase family 18 protein [Nostoc sp.]|uniref:glycosyl hydrolase family 18 protein n=1 Tax=Nostoc sp. TaxID=1180 RepID=UPI002FFC8CA6
MGLSTDYLGIPDWVNKPEGYQAGVTVRYNQNIFKTAFWGSEPGVGNPEENGWRFDDELYDLTSQAHTQVADYVEWIGVMSYDLTGASDKSPVGPHTKLFSIREQKAYTPEQQEKPWPALPERPPKPDDNPIISVEDSLWYWSNSYFVNWQTKGQGLPRNKLAFGVPTYGYDFAYKKDQDPQSHEIPPGYKVIQYKDIVRNYPYSDTAPYANIKELGSTPRPDFVSHVPGNYPYAHNIYFETPETAVEKLKFLKYVGVQGVIVWDITGDDWQGNKSIIKALYQAKDLPVDLSAISGFYTKKQQYPNVPVGVEKVSQAAPV